MKDELWMDAGEFFQEHSVNVTYQTAEKQNVYGGS
jgi:hypothetical protein